MHTTENTHTHTHTYIHTQLYKIIECNITPSGDPRFLETMVLFTFALDTDQSVCTLICQASILTAQGRSENDFGISIRYVMTMSDDM